MLYALKKKYWDLRRVMLNNRASVELSRLDLKFVPWSNAAIQPASLMNILNEILINRRSNIVEFGSGISTLYIARVLSEAGGRLISFEDNPEWVALVRQMLTREGLTESVTLVDAPLKKSRFSLDDLQWYDENVIEKELSDFKVDLMLVDGPPAYEAGKGLARYPALPAVFTHLNERCAIILDDIGRAGERQVLERWRVWPGFDFDVDVHVIPNFALCRRGQYFSSAF